MQQKKGIYRQRHPEQTACYKIFQNHYKSFRDSYEERYEWRYGYFRPLIDEELEKYLRCGILKYGFARIRCNECGKEMLLPFSCKSRICASCLTKRMFEFEEYIMEEMIKQVPHRRPKEVPTGAHGFLFAKDIKERVYAEPEIFE